MAFYDDMQQVARDLLAPDTAGGLGQGAITIKRLTMPEPDPAQPWVPVVPVETTEDVNQIGTTKAEYVNAGTLVVTDLAYVIEAPRVLLPELNDTIEIDGEHVGRVVHVVKFPPHGTTVLWKLFVNS